MAIGGPAKGDRRVEDQALASTRLEPGRRLATVTVARQALAALPGREAEAPHGVVQEGHLQGRGSFARRAPGVVAICAALKKGMARARKPKVEHLLGGAGTVMEGEVLPLPMDGRALAVNAGARPSLRVRVGADATGERVVARRAAA